MLHLLVSLALAGQPNYPEDPDCVSYGSTQAACEELQRQGNVAEKSLNATYQRLLKRLDFAASKSSFFSQAKVDLVAAQRAWVSFREKDCDARADTYQGLQLLSGIGNTCRLHRARQRTEELQEILDDLDALDEP